MLSVLAASVLHSEGIDHQTEDDRTGGMSTETWSALRRDNKMDTTPAVLLLVLFLSLSLSLVATAVPFKPALFYVVSSLVCFGTSRACHTGL
jgi:hypothetical protein